MPRKPADTLSHEVNIAVLPSSGLRVRLDADEAVLEELARISGVVSVNSFKCELLFRRWHRNGVTVTGEITAEVTQECVVTLDPVRSRVEEEIERIFVPDGSKLAKPRLNQEGELVVDYDGKDEPETFEGDTLNAWDIAIEHFLLGIDPFPRREGVSLDAALGPEETGAGDDEKPNPFAALKDLIDPEK